MDGFEAGKQFQGERTSHFGRLDLYQRKNPSALDPNGVLSGGKERAGAPSCLEGPVMCVENEVHSRQIVCAVEDTPFSAEYSGILFINILNSSVPLPAAMELF